MRRIKILSTAVFIVILCSLTLSITNDASAGSVVWSGHISVDTTWEPNGSPYWIKGTVTVDTNTTLRIENDVEVRFDKGSGLFIEGVLLVLGQDGLQARLTSNESSASPNDWLGIRINKTGRAQIEHCVVEYSISGVEIAGASNSSIHQCIFRNNTYGVRLQSSVNITIRDSEMKFNQIGVFAEDLSNSALEDVLLATNDRGLHLLDSVNNSFLNLRSTENKYDGVYLESSNNNSLLGGTLSTNGRFGLFLDKSPGGGQSQNNSVVGLNISGNVGGIHIQDSSFNRIQETNITNNINGIFIVQPSRNNSVVRNSMLGNLQYAIISSATNEIESNYFGTSYPGQLEKLVDGGILVQNPLPFRETGFEEVSGDVTWSATKMTKKAILVTGNLTLDGVEIEFYSESGLNFVQVLGSLVIRDSFLHSSNGNFSILFLNKSSGHIENSNLEGQVGIGIHTEKNLTISDTTIRNGRAGIFAHQSRGGVFDSIRILNSLMGLSFSESSHYTVNNSVFVSNQGTGVSLYLSSNITVTQCNISSNGLRGVDISLSQTNLLAYNNISYNEEFGLFLSNSQDNLMYGNNFIDNIFQVYDGDNLSSYDNGYPVGGNFWSDYAGSDLLGGPIQDIPGSDGIGDTPYNIPLLSWDRYPLISPSLASGNRSLLDTTSPARITDLAVIGTGAFSATLTWTAPGDDGSSGFASAYDLRYSLSPITEATWNSAVKYNTSFIPGPPGSLELETVSGLWEANDYYFAIKASDEVPNWADLSNVVFGRTRDISPPQIDYLDVSPEQREVFEPVNISAVIVDNVNVAFSVINISKSNSFNTTATMDQGDGDRFYLNGSYVELGIHTFSIWTCDNSDNCNYSSGEFEIVDLTPPIANAGSDMIVKIGQSISLDASNSTDNYGIANYTWIIMNDERILHHYGQFLTYSFDSEGEFNATLVVTDFAGNQDEDWLKISVKKEPIRDPLDLVWLVVLVVVIAVVILLVITVIWHRGRREEEDETEKNQPETPIKP